MNQIRFYSGMKYRSADEAEAGAVCAVTGLSHVIPGDALGSADPDSGEVLEPFMTYSVIVPEGMDVHTVLRHFRELGEEDPKLHVTWNSETSEIGIRLTENGAMVPHASVSGLILSHPPHATLP